MLARPSEGFGGDEKGACSDAVLEVRAAWSTRVTCGSVQQWLGSTRIQPCDLVQDEHS